MADCGFWTLVASFGFWIVLANLGHSWQISFFNLHYFSGTLSQTAFGGSQRFESCRCPKFRKFFEIKSDHNTARYLSYSLREVGGFFDVPC